MPQLLITPRALAALNGHNYPAPRAEEPADTLLELLHRHESLSQEEFLLELRKQRNSEEVASS
jgi:hypothetical protein